MIKYKVKDLIAAMQEGEINVIAHQANCFNVMGAGIAPLIAAAFPQMKQADNRTAVGDARKLGYHTFAKISNGVGYNLYGQYDTGGVATNYNALRSALRSMYFSLKATDKENIKIGMPKIGAGLGGGDWSKIELIIEQELLDYDVTIYVLDQSEIPAESAGDIFLKELV